MRIDLHCHSRLSDDNYLEPESVIQEALAKKLDGVCFPRNTTPTRFHCCW